MNFQVGDKVRIRRDLEVGKTYGSRYMFIEEMMKYRGQIVEITIVCDDGSFMINDCGNHYFFCEEMVEKIQDEENVILSDEQKKIIIESLNKKLKDNIEYTDSYEKYILKIASTMDILKEIPIGDDIVCLILPILNEKMVNIRKELKEKEDERWDLIKAIDKIKKL